MSHQIKGDWYKKAQQTQVQNPSLDAFAEITIVPYADRFWAVKLGNELLAVVLYKKGAKEIEAVLTMLRLHVMSCRKSQNSQNSQNIIGTPPLARPSVTSNEGLPDVAVMKQEEEDKNKSYKIAR